MCVIIPHSAVSEPLLSAGTDSPSSTVGDLLESGDPLLSLSSPPRTTFNRLLSD